MSLLVDTSVWSLAFRRDGQPGVPEVGALRGALLGAEQVFTTGLVLQEVLQGFAGPRNRDQLVERLSVLAFLQPDKLDHIAAADIRNACRRRGVQIGTIDALLIQLCQRYDLTLLTTDQDFHAASQLAGIAAEAEGRQVAEVACAAVGAAALAAGDAVEGEPCPPSAHQDPAGHVLRRGRAAAAMELRENQGLVNVAPAHALGDLVPQALVGGGGG